MASKIRVDQNEIQNKAKKIRNYKKEHEENMKRLTRIVMQTSSHWEGEEHDALIANFCRLTTVIKQFDETLEKVASHMQYASKSMTQFDEEKSKEIARV